MEDVLPDDHKYWDVVADTVQRVCTGFNMKPISTPIVEEAMLFTKSIGEGTDIVEKEMFFLKERGGAARLALRPEFTAGAVRAFLEHGMASWPQPVRLWYLGPVFRHDRPQAGRYRQFSQFGVEVIGEKHAVVDAQVIHLVYEIYKSLQLDAFRIEINSLGCRDPSCRPAYLSVLKAHAQEHVRKLCADCRRRAKTNPLRILDCQEEKCQLVANTAPKLLDRLCEACKAHYAQVLQYLQAFAIPLRENPRLVRGLDYYTRTVFEMISTLPSSEGLGGLAIGSGGRYDGLVELLGGPSTPAIGFSGGVERTILQMRAEGVEVNVTDAPDLFLVHLGALGQRKCLTLFDDLRRAGFRVAEAFHKEGIKAQLRVADRLRVPWVLILGQKEALDNTILLRNMDSGMQETLGVHFDALLPALRKRLRRDVFPVAGTQE
jgi:histidyl-tRNA synthetase